MPSSGFKKCALRSEEHTSELQSHDNLVCRLLLGKSEHHDVDPGALGHLGRARVAGLPAGPPRGGAVRRAPAAAAAVRRDGRPMRPRFLMMRRPPRSPLLPYAPAFRS